MATTDLHFVCGSLKPVHRGVRFLGGAVDDEIAVDAAGVALRTLNHTKGTVTAWIMVPDNTGNYCFFSAGDKNAVEYYYFRVEAGTIHVMSVLATPTTQIDVNTAANTITPHKWHHVAIVQDGVRMKIYIDGEDMPLTWTVETTPSRWFEGLDQIDTAIIGGAISVAGGDAITEEFKGYISDVRVYSGTADAAALSQEEIKRVMSGEILVQSTYMHNRWALDKDLIDEGTGADNGTAAGDIIFSAANEFASRLTFLETVPLTADNITIMADAGVGYAYSVLAA